MFEHIINWTLQKGSHPFPGPDGGTCINEAALVAAGFEYRAINSAADMPACFSRVIAQYALSLNDRLPDQQLTLLKPYILRLAGTADTPDIERERAKYLAMQAVTVFAASALDAAGLHELAATCRAAKTLREAYAAAWTAAPLSAVSAAALSAVKAASAAQGAGTPKAEEMAAASAAVSAAEAAEITAKAVRRATTVWNDALAALDGVLAIGRQAEPIEPPLALERMERAKVRA